MPLDLTEVVKKVATVDVYRELGRMSLAGQLIVKYKPYAETADDRLDLAETFDSKVYTDIVQTDIERLVATVVEWDLLKDGETVPLTVEGIREAGVSSQILDDIGSAIRSHSEGPNRKRDKR